MWVHRYPEVIRGSCWSDGLFSTAEANDRNQQCLGQAGAIPDLKIRFLQLGIGRLCRSVKTPLSALNGTDYHPAAFVRWSVKIEDFRRAGRS